MGARATKRKNFSGWSRQQRKREERQRKEEQRQMDYAEREKRAAEERARTEKLSQDAETVVEALAAFFKGEARIVMADEGGFKFVRD